MSSGRLTEPLIFCRRDPVRAGERVRSRTERL